MGLVTLASLLIWKHWAQAMPPAIGVFDGYPNDIFLHLDINGDPGLFSLDSGSDGSYVSPGPEPKDPGPATTDWKLSLGGSSLAMVHAQREGGQHLLQTAVPRPLGSLGTDFLRQVVLMIDPRSGKFAIWPRDRCSFAQAVDWARRNPDWAWPADFGGYWQEQALGVSQGCTTIPVSIDSRRLALILDTGSSVSGISRERLNQVRHWSLFQVTIETFSKETYYPFYLVPGIRTAFLQAPISVVMSQFDNSGGIEGVYALDLLNQGQWILDEGHKMLAFKQYKPDGYLRLRTPGFYLFWKAGEALVDICDMEGHTKGRICTLVTIDGKPFSNVLNPPTGDPIPPGDLALFGHQLHELFSKPFRLGLKDGKLDRTVSIDPLKWFQ